MTNTRKLISTLLVLLASIGVFSAVNASSASASDTRWAYTNGCTLSPDGIPGVFNFREICNLHDVCYARFANGSHQYGTNESGRSLCDGQFLSRMRGHCLSRFGSLDPRRGVCLRTADTYYNAVRAFGAPFYYDFNTRW